MNWGKRIRTQEPCGGESFFNKKGGEESSGIRPHRYDRAVSNIGAFLTLYLLSHVRKLSDRGLLQDFLSRKKYRWNDGERIGALMEAKLLGYDRGWLWRSRFESMSQLDAFPKNVVVNFMDVQDDLLYTYTFTGSLFYPLLETSISETLTPPLPQDFPFGGNGRVNRCSHPHLWYSEHFINRRQHCRLHSSTSSSRSASPWKMFDCDHDGKQTYLFQKC